jgi:hypothetical protein
MTKPGIPSRRHVGFVTLFCVVVACNRHDEGGQMEDDRNGVAASAGGDGGIVLGQELAAALEAERRQAETRVFKSPLPPSEYDFWRGETNLLHLKPAPLDDQLRTLCDRYRRSTPVERQVLRRSCSMDDFYTLLMFARREAVAALRSKEIGRVIDGPAAVAMIERERIDYRDGLTSLAPLHHAASRVGGDPRRLFADAAGMSEPGTAELITSFAGRDPEDRALRAFGYTELEIPAGIGLVRTGYRRYEPVLPLAQAALDLAALVDRDRYGTDEVEIATDLPAVWLFRDDDAEGMKAVKSIRGGATINGLLRSTESADHASQQFTLFLVETATVAEARLLLDASKRKGRIDHAMLGVASGELFCLVVARSVVDGVNGVETTESLTRFRSDIQQVLDRYAATQS